MKKYVSKLHYLTQDIPGGKDHIQQVRLACEAGANWIQYRCFSKAEHELLEELGQISMICDDWGTTLVVTDHIGLIDKADIQGVHIEDMQADFLAIRNAIGDDKTLGASANTIDDIRRIARSGVVDYIGCGPLRETLTKPNSYPLLGIEGYQAIVKTMEEENITIPLLAVGGVIASDVPALLEAGVYGVAVSAYVNLSPDPAQAYKEIYRTLY